MTQSVMERSLTSATRARKISTSCSTSMRVGPGGARIFISTSSRSVSSDACKCQQLDLAAQARCQGAADRSASMHEGPSGADHHQHQLALCTQQRHMAQTRHRGAASRAAPCALGPAAPGHLIIVVLNMSEVMRTTATMQKLCMLLLSGLHCCSHI